MSSNLASHLKNLTGSKITDHKKRKVQKDTTGTIYLSMFISQNLQDFMYNFLYGQKMFNTLYTKYIWVGYHIKNL